MPNLDYIPKYTFSDYITWKGDWELIRGNPISMSPSPTRKHQLVSSNLHFQLYNSLKKTNNKCNCKVYFELDWKVQKDTVVCPDITLVCNEKETDFIETVPNLIIEILSPSTHLKDRNTKFGIYQENGVKYYLMIDAVAEKIEIYQLIDNQYKEVTMNEFMISKDCKIEIDFDNIFE